MIHLALWSHFLILPGDFYVETGMWSIMCLVRDVVSLLLTERLKSLCKTLVYVELHMQIAVNTETM